MSLAPATLARKIAESKIYKERERRNRNTKIFVDCYIGLKIIDAARKGKRAVTLYFNRLFDDIPSVALNGERDNRIPEDIDYNNLSLEMIARCLEEAGYRTQIPQTLTNIYSINIAW